MTTRRDDVLRVVSYNVHGWKDAYGKKDGDGIVEVLTSLDADMVALQEVLSPGHHDGECSMTELATRLGMHITFGETLLRRDSHFGNALLSKAAPTLIQRHTLTCLGHEPRGALEVQFQHGETRVRVLVTHLSLKREERCCQLDSVREFALAPGVDVTILLGDLNEWFPWGYVNRRLDDVFHPMRKPRTFPSRLPLFSLDRVLVRPGHRLLSLHAERSGSARTASDHLPLVAEVDVGNERS